MYTFGNDDGRVNVEYRRTFGCIFHIVVSV